LMRNSDHEGAAQTGVFWRVTFQSWCDNFGRRWLSNMRENGASAQAAA
jgi:hypothetical protein